MSTDRRTFHNILLIQLRRIGDVLMTTPAIRALRQAYPEAQISFLTEPPSDQILHHNPYLNEVFLFPKKPSLKTYLKFLWQIRQKRFDLVVDFFSNPRSAQISWMSRAAHRIGFDFPGRRFYYTDRVALDGENYAAVHKSLLLNSLGIRTDSWALDFFISNSDRQYAEALFRQMGLKENDFVVSISPVSRQPYKIWPASHFAKIADHLIEQFDARILFIYGPGEIHLVEQVRQHMQHPALPNYDVPSLSETKALFEKVDLHIGNDNGPCHFAIAAGTPTVAIFGKPKAINWTPPSKDQTYQRHQAVEYDPGCKNQCTYPQCEHLSCINDIKPEQVQQIMLELIDQLQLKKSYV